MPRLHSWCLNAGCRCGGPPDDVWAAMLVARYAQRIGLPAGSLWGPNIARSIAADLALGLDRDTVEAEWDFRLFGEVRHDA